MFLGFAPSPLTPELGKLVSDGINFVSIAPWLIVFPGLTIVIVALGFNLLGDGIRDILDTSAETLNRVILSSCETLGIFC